MLWVMRARLVVVLLSLALVACTEGDQHPAKASVRAEHADAERFSAALLAAARDYWMWSRVDEHPRAAPPPCADPSSVSQAEGGFPSHARLSKADDGAHEAKLYYLFAGLDGRSARKLYASLGLDPTSRGLGLTSSNRAPPREPSPLPVGFTIVKQSWKTASKPRSAEPRPERMIQTPEPVTFVIHEDETLYVGEQAELFIMIKLGAPDLEGTDAGWIYGTVTADGKTVTSTGKVEPCMDCHEAAPHERLFRAPDDPGAGRDSQAVGRRTTIDRGSRGDRRPHRSGQTSMKNRCSCGSASGLRSPRSALRSSLRICGPKASTSVDTNASPPKRSMFSRWRSSTTAS